MKARKPEEDSAYRVKKVTSLILKYEFPVN